MCSPGTHRIPEAPWRAPPRCLHPRSGSMQLDSSRRQLPEGDPLLMLTREEDVEIHALHQRGWKIADIARRTGRDRKTIRSYLNGTTTPGVRNAASPTPSRCSWPTSSHA